MAASQGKKFDQEKPKWNLLPLRAVEEIVKVLTFGARKYAPEGWKAVPRARERYEAALLRHIAARQAGDLVDRDSGLMHSAHIGCNAVFLIWFDLQSVAGSKHG